MEDARHSIDPIRQRAAEDLFDAVRSLPERERESAIDSGSQDAWVRGEVRSLLRFDASTVATIGGSDGESFDSEACLGLSVDGFTLRRVIGVGGMGTVFEADQVLPTRRVALKVLHGARARASTLARFRKESEFLARLDHPNIARVIAAGTLHLQKDGSALPYFAMELVDDGRTISRWAHDEQPSRRELVRMLATACDAIGSGHRAGIVHLDLKPGNLLVSRSGALRVIDYGIARSLDANDDGPDASLSGTPQYMGPEQVTRGARVDSRADVYALGLILYELLAGRLPYQTSGEPFAAVSRIVRETAPAPLRLVDATIPGDLAAIAHKATAKDADARYGTASELADDLRRWLADESVLAAPPNTVGAIARLVRRNPAGTALAVLALMAIVAGAATSLRFAAQSAKAADERRVAAARAHLIAASASMAAREPADAERQLVGIPEDLRGWEFRYLLAQMATSRLLARAESEVLSIASIASTGEVVGGVTSGTIVVADIEGVRPPEKFVLAALYDAPMQASVPAVTASRDGSVLFVNTGEYRLFSLDRRDAVARRLSDASIRTRMCGNLLANAGADGSVELLDPATGSRSARCEGFGSAVDASFSSDGRLALISSSSGVLRLVELDPTALRVQERWRTVARETSARAVAVANDGAFAIAAWNDGRISRHDGATGRVLADKDLRGGSVFDIALSPDARTAAASSWSNDVRLIDAETLGFTRRLGGTNSHVWGIEFTADGTRIVGRIQRLLQHGTTDVVSVDCVGAWSLTEPRPMRDHDLGTTLTAAQAGPEPWRFTACASDGAIFEFDARSGSSTQIGSGGPGVRSIARTDAWIALGEENGFVRLLRTDGERLREAWRERVLNGAITAIGASPEGASIVVGDDDHSVGAVDLVTGSTRWKAEVALGSPPPMRRGMFRPVFVDDGAAVTFATHLTSVACPTYRVTDGRILPGRFGTVGWETSDAFMRDGEIYGLGITGYITRGARNVEGALVHFALNGGVMCRD